VIGAGSGIGRAVSHRLVEEGAVVAAADLDLVAARETSETILSGIGMGIGVAGTGLSGAGDVIGLGVDATERASIRSALEDVVLAYGGIDHLVVTSGVYVSSDSDGNVPDASWEKSFRVNVTAPYLLADEARTIWERQGLGGSMVVTTSVNAVVPKSGSPAYDASKAAANHLVRELAVKLAPLVRVNGVAPATVVAGSAMFPRERVMASLDKYGVAYEDGDDTESLRERLAAFYAQRTLTKKPISPADQAEAIFLLLGDRLGKTTGQVINVDGGLPEAFLR
jgi:NAD(P)-dependent dehydrogenase (short-subunit alcohol dehydrogenase family)